MNEQKNLIVAVSLAVFILLGFNYFYERPKHDILMRQAEIAKQAEIEKLTAVETKAPEPSNTILPLSEALQLNSRITIETDRLKGSINLTGCCLDDLLLLDYHETVDKSSPPIVLLSPDRVKGAYHADFGWVAKDATL
mgnify:FL=1